LYLISRNSNDEKLKRHYQVYCKILLKVLKEAKKLYYDTKIKKSNKKHKATWEIIKKLTNNHYSHIDIQELMIDSKHLKDPYNIADAFNDYFSSIVDNLNMNKVNYKNNNAKVFTTQYYLEQNYAHPTTPLFIKTFSTKEISSVIKALKTKNSHGFDEISDKLLEVSATDICSPLTHICNKSILSGIFPDHRKFSIVKPIYKKGNKMNPTKYRPISLLTSFSKVFEKALYIRVTEHLNTNNLLVGN